MINSEENKKKVKEQILELEKSSLANINKTDDKQMVQKIIRLFEEVKKNDNQ